MPLAGGDKLGPYEIVSLLGAGGMGEVYRARDTRLGRDIALKVSAERFSERFEKEARAIAALNHTNVCTLHDVGPNYLVMELVEGVTLAERIKEGAIPLEEILDIARQIAAALEAAHEKGITHRDLKPGNIILKPGGAQGSTVKVLDFGLAKIGGTPTAQSEHSPTLTMGATQVGMILGTAAYMAPEQARGREVDKRADIWAFGVVLHEMLTGKRAFEGEDLADTLASVVKSDPDLTLVPPGVRKLLAKCLQKDPKKRLRDIGDFELLLASGEAAAPPSRSRLKMMIAITAAAGFTLALAGLGSVHFRETPPRIPLVRFTVGPPDKGRFAPVLYTTPAGTISSDGDRIAFPASGADGKQSIWLRSLDSPVPRALPGTENAIVGCWSPDGKNLAFYAGGKLKQIEIANGLVHTLADALAFGLCAWNQDGVILIPGTQINRLSASEGAVTPATLAKVKNTSQLAGERYPVFLPDGRHFLFETGNPETDVWIASLDAPNEATHLMTSVSQVLYSGGQLLFLSGNTLVARSFDPTSLTFRGEAVPIAEHVRSNVNRITNFAAFSVSSNGWLVYQQGFGPEYLNLTLLDRNGKRAGVIGEPAEFFSAAYSPDRKNIAAVVTDASGGGSTSDIWIYDAQRGIPTRFTFGPAIHNAPEWSPDGRTMAFFSYGKVGMYRKPTDGSANEELLVAGASPRSFSPDGTFLAYVLRDPKNGTDIWMLPEPLGKAGTSKPVPFIATAFNEEFPRFSPDGKWVAYQSDESGRNEIYIASFPNPSTKRQISNGGGIRPRWNPNGKELFFITPDQKMMSAEITLGTVPQPGAARVLFAGFTPAGYDVSSDGQRFLTVLEPEGKTEEPLTVVQNWQAGLKK